MRQRTVIPLVLSLARHNNGVVTFAQAHALGVHSRQLRAMIDLGTLVRIHPGIYVEAARVDDAFTKTWAAMAYVGAGALVSHRSAAWLQGLVDSPGPVVHITLSRRPSGRSRGVQLHRSEVMPEALSYRGLRCTTPARTIVDMAAGLNLPGMNSMIDRALIGGLTRAADLERESAAGRTTCRVRGSWHWKDGWCCPSPGGRFSTSRPLWPRSSGGPSNGWPPRPRIQSSTEMACFGQTWAALRTFSLSSGPGFSFKT